MNNQIMILLLGLISVGMIFGAGALRDARRVLEDEIVRMKRQLGEGEGGG